VLCHGSINLKQAPKGTNNNCSSGSQGMQRQEKSSNELRLKKNEITNQTNSQMISMNHTDVKDCYARKKFMPS
jgi:hypothetical protein